MAEAMHIKDFLIGLGFAIDETSAKKFEDGIDTAGKRVAEMAAGAALALQGMFNVVNKFNETWTNLFYTSQRSGAAVADINALSYAFKQLANISPEEVLQNVYSMSQAFHNPNVEAFIDQMTGVKKGASDRERFEGLSKLFHQLDSQGLQFQTDQIAATAGLSPAMRDALRNNKPADIAKKLAEADAMNKGNDQEKAARDAAEATRKQAELDARIKAGGLGILDSLDTYLVTPLRELANQLATQMPGLAGAIGIGKDSGIGSFLAGVAKDIIEYRLLSSLVAGGAGTGAATAVAGAGIGALMGVVMSSVMAGLGAAGVLFGGRAAINNFEPLNKFIAWLDKLTGLGGLDERYGFHTGGHSDATPTASADDASPPPASRSGFWHIFGQLFGIASADAAEVPPTEVDKDKARQMANAVQTRVLQDYARAIGQDLDPSRDPDGGGTGARPGRELAPDSAGPAGSSSGGSLGADSGSAGIGLSPRAKLMMGYFKRLGYDDMHAATAAAQLFAESKGRENAVGDGGSAYGAAQWHRDRQEHFREAMGKDIHGSTLEEQVNFFDKELHRWEKRTGGDRFFAANNTRDATSALVDTERPADRAGARATRLHMSNDLLSATTAGATAAGDDKSVTVTQHNNVTIQGNGDPHSTGHEVREQLGRQTADLQRTLQGAVR